MTLNRNKKVLNDFIKYCKANPELRFWQALRNWSGYPYIYVAKSPDDLTDTFYWEEKTK